MLPLYLRLAASPSGMASGVWLRRFVHKLPELVKPLAPAGNHPYVGEWTSLEWAEEPGNEPVLVARYAFGKVAEPSLDLDIRVQSPARGESGDSWLIIEKKPPTEDSKHRFVDASTNRELERHELLLPRINELSIKELACVYKKNFGEPPAHFLEFRIPYVPPLAEEKPSVTAVSVASTVHTPAPQSEQSKWAEWERNNPILATVLGVIASVLALVVCVYLIIAVFFLFIKPFGMYLDYVYDKEEKEWKQRMGLDED